jgi:short-subunit dehydrogenase
MNKLENRSVLITGASRGIGRAIAQSLATENANLILSGRNMNMLEETAKLCRDNGAAQVSCHNVDLSDNDAIDKFCEELIEKGGVDMLVNNAGDFVQGHALNGDADTWDAAMKLNLLTPMRLTRSLSPGMKDREWGIIVNMGSVAAIEGMKGVGAYAATKHGLRGWSLSCYQQLREYGIKVVLINPAFVNTDMTAGVEVNDRDLILQPEDIAEAVMLAVNSSPACCPEEITLRLTRNAM